MTNLDSVRDLRIGRLSRQEALPVSEVHMLSFKTFFLTSLGRRFIQEFYRCVLQEPTGCGVGAFQADGALIGFSVGSLQADGFYRTLARRHGWRLLVAALPVLARHPSKGWRILQSLRGGSGNPVPGAAYLISLAVHPEQQGKGVGQVLVEAFEREIRILGGRLIILTTDTENNEPVNRFYRNQGYGLHDTYTTLYGRKLNRYAKRLPT